MPLQWRSRTLGVVGIGALVLGAGIVVAAPASAAAVPDAATLRQAISGLNGTGPASEIELTPGVTYSLPGSSGCKDEDGNASGDLDILRTQPLKIFTPDGQPPAVLDMTCDAAKTPQRVIQMSGPDGGTAGKLTLRNVVVRNGHTPDRDAGVHLGGGVLSTGEVVVENSVFENNAAGKGKSGNADSTDGGVGGLGGAIFTLAAVTITGTTFTGNRGGDGGTAFNNGGSGCTGGDGGQGGAVWAGLGVTITNATFSGNSAGNGGNGADGPCLKPQTQSQVGGDGGQGGTGGAVQCGLLNLADDERQLFPCAGSMVIKGSTFNGNLAGNAGTGGKSGSTSGTGGTGGEGGAGGAILYIGRANAANGPLMLTVENTTIDGNSSGNGGTGGDGGNAGTGGPGGRGGAVYAQFSDRPGAAVEVAKLTHVTVTENGGGGSGGAAGTPGTTPDTTPDNTVAAATGTNGNPGETRGGSLAIFDGWTSVSTVVGTGAPTTDGPDCWRAATTVTFSRSTDADVTDPVLGCGFGAGSVLPFAGFALAGLADNGGATKTRLPAAASTLVDKVTAVTGQLAVDQRGVSRPQGTGADIGAAELQLIDMTVTKTASPASVTAGEPVTFTITAKNTGTSSPQPAVVLDDPNCTGMTNAVGDVNTNNTLDPGETFTYTCTATPTEVGTFTNTVTATITDGAGVKITRTASADVSVTAAVGGASPPLANTGTNNPTAELVTGGFLVIGGVVLLYLARPRRLRVRANDAAS